MPNAKDADVGIPRILAVGTSGAGKTTAAVTIPGRKFAYLFDPNALQSIRGYDIEYEYFPPGDLDIEAITLRKEAGSVVRDNYGRVKEPMSYVEWEVDFEDRLDNGFFKDYDAIIFDGMTSFQSIVMDRILYLNKRVGKWPEQDDWTGTMNTTINVMRKMASMQDLLLYVTCHFDFRQDKESKRMMNRLNLIGQMRMYFPQLFSDIWEFYPDERADGTIRRMVRTQPGQYSSYLRSSIRGLDVEEDVTIEDFSNAERYGIGALLEKSTGFRYNPGKIEDTATL